MLAHGGEIPDVHASMGNQIFPQAMSRLLCTKTCMEQPEEFNRIVLDFLGSLEKIGRIDST
jgi:hypothetical protein